MEVTSVGSLHALVRKGDFKSVKEALEVGQLDINIKDIFGNTLLHYAVEGHLQIVALLLSLGANVDTRNSEGASALHQAAVGNFLGCALALLKHNALPNCLDNEHSSPLHHSASSNSADVASLLLQYGANKNATDSDGYTPLHHAAFNNSVETMKVLLKAGVDVNAHNEQDGSTALHLAAFGGYSSCVEMLVSNGANIHLVDNDGASPVHKAAHQGATDCLAYLVERGADVHQMDNTLSTPLHHASYQGKLQCIDYLVKLGSSISQVNKHGRTALQLAQLRGHYECVQYLERVYSKLSPSLSQTDCSADEGKPRYLNEKDEQGIQETMKSTREDELEQMEDTTESPKDIHTEEERLTIEAAKDFHVQNAIDEKLNVQPETQKTGAEVNEEHLSIDHGPKKKENRKSSKSKTDKEEDFTKKKDRRSGNSKDKSKSKEEEIAQKRRKSDAGVHIVRETSFRDMVFNTIEKGNLLKAKFFEGKTHKNERIMGTIQSGHEGSFCQEKGSAKKIEKKKKVPKAEKKKEKIEKNNKGEGKDIKKDREVKHGEMDQTEHAHEQLNGDCEKKQTEEKEHEEKRMNVGCTEKSRSNTSSTNCDLANVEGMSDNDASLLSEDSEEEFFSEAKDYSRYDKYGFLKESQIIPTSQEQGFKEAQRALKWTKIIQKWPQIRKKKNMKLHGRVAKGIPDCVRGAAWKLMANADQVQAASKLSYPDLCRRAQGSEYSHQIDLDIKRTYRNHFMFREKKGFGQKALSNLLKAYSVYDIQVGYCQGMASMAALLIMYLEEEAAWWTLVGLLNQYDMRGLYQPGFPRLFECFYVHEYLFKKQLPILHAHFAKEGIISSMYATKWYLNTFLGALPFPCVLRLWELFMWGGFEVLHKMGLAVLKMYESELMSLDFAELLSFINDLPKKSIDPSDLIRLYKKITFKPKKIVKLGQAYTKAQQEQQQSQPEQTPTKSTRPSKSL